MEDALSYLVAAVLIVLTLWLPYYISKRSAFFRERKYLRWLAVVVIPQLIAWQFIVTFSILDHWIPLTLLVYVYFLVYFGVYVVCPIVFIEFIVYLIKIYKRLRQNKKEQL